MAENPLHNEQVADVEFATGAQGQAEMVLVDDDQPFSMNTSENHYGQKLINIDNKGNRLSGGPGTTTVDSRMSAVSLSNGAHEIEPGTLPEAFQETGQKRDPRGSVKYN